MQTASRKKLLRTARLCFKSVLNGAVATIHQPALQLNIPDVYGTYGIPFTQEDVQKRDDNVHVPLHTLMGTE